MEGYGLRAPHRMFLIAFSTFVLALPVASKAIAQSASQAESNKALVARFYSDVFVDWDRQLVDEMLSPDLYAALVARSEEVRRQCANEGSTRLLTPLIRPVRITATGGLPGRVEVVNIPQVRDAA